MSDRNNPHTMFRFWTSFVLLLVLSLPSVAQVNVLPVFTSQIICDTDGTFDTPFTDTKGLVTIFNNGDLALTIPAGLRPDTKYTVRLICGAVGAPDALRSTNGQGRLLTIIPRMGRQGHLAPGCGLPVVTIFTDDPDDFGDFCQTGYGSP